ncbi:hypothetical protein [Achromobacter xylosoxidans]|uniref:hypothetical protein n=1 Tax=Alcaligenes xylosoxydans xylosoxydans TaxID=85698 RepID=UPI0023684EE1|nr:hypothetical protein [Achromobacter xylosoxidans]MDD7988731.1 hypothetical protein [Achromobacter xylosoxidans]
MPSVVSPPLSAARKFLVLAAVCLACAAMPFTFTGPAIALPAIAGGPGGRPGGGGGGRWGGGGGGPAGGPHALPGGPRGPGAIA